MGFTKLGDPFVGIFHYILSTIDVMEQVGPVVDPSGLRPHFEGQYISAGYCGHGMPRAYAWWVPLFSKVSLLC